jgi:hypothetical protein
MIVPKSSFLLLLLAAVDSTTDHLRHQRQLKTGDDGGGGPLEEPGECIPFLSDAVFDAPEGQQSILEQTTDASCLDNECGGGCCRFFNYLECDTTNNFYWLTVSDYTSVLSIYPLFRVLTYLLRSTLPKQCVCNANTNNTHLPGGNWTDDSRSDTDDATDDGFVDIGTPPPAVAGDCDVQTPFQHVPGYTACSGPSDCTVSGECCVAVWCVCKAQNDPGVNEQCVPAP